VERENKMMSIFISILRVFFFGDTQMNKNRMIKLAGLLKESKKPLNEAKGGVIDQLYDVIDFAPTIENKIEDEIEKYSQKIHKEYIDKLNSTHRSKLQSLVGKIITEKDVIDADRNGLAIPFYNRPPKNILGSPIKSASFKFVKISAGKYFLKLLLKFENGKSLNL
jgi:hypothetical protein